MLTFKSWEPKIVTEPNEILLNQTVWSHSHVVLSLNDLIKVAAWWVKKHLVYIDRWFVLIHFNS